MGADDWTSRGRHTTYADAGVDRTAASRAVELIRHRVRSTFRPEVVGDIGGFGGLFALDPSRYEDPLLVSGTDGVGTKVLIAQKLGVHDTIGIDLVAMSANDVAAMGAEPLFFLDYILIEKVDEDLIDQVVKGIVAGCREAGCALIGGEIAEHPGHLLPGSYDLAGFCVGAVERQHLVTGSEIKPGDVVIGIESSGLHSNGFSLVRKVFAESDIELHDRTPGLTSTWGEELLRPTLIYARVVSALLKGVRIKGLAHITQGGIPENLGRILPEGLAASVDRTTWAPPAIFDLIASLGGVSAEEMFSTFNMGIGMIAVVEESQANHAIEIILSCDHRAQQIGIVTSAREEGPRVAIN